MPIPEDESPRLKLYKHDRHKQWSSIILFAAAVTVCCVLCALIAERANPEFHRISYQYVLAVSTMLSLAAYSSLQYYQWRRETMEALKVLEQAEPEMESIITAATRQKPEQRPLVPIWEKLQAGRLHHQDILVHITSLQYALANSLILSSIGGGIAAFFILPEGWGQAPETQKTLFLAFAVMAAYCQTVPKVLSLSSNLTIHLARYHAFLTLRWHLYRYIVTGQGTDGKKQDFALFLNDLTQRLVELPPAPFGIDPSQVTSIAALAQQFSLSPPQSAAAQNANQGGGNASEQNRPAGANAANGAGNAAGAETPAGSPGYSAMNTYRRSELKQGQLLAGVTSNAGQVGKAEVTGAPLPRWMALNAETGAITLADEATAETGDYKTTVTLTTRAQQSVPALVQIVVAPDPGSPVDPTASPAANPGVGTSAAAADNQEVA